MKITLIEKKSSFNKKTILSMLIILSIISISFAQTWYSVEPRATDKTLDAIYFCDSLNGWAVGYDGAVIHSSDGGFTWAPQTSGVSDTLYDVYFSDISHGWAVGRNGCVIKTVDGGTTWAKLLKRTNGMLIKVLASGDTVIIISQFNLLFKSIDAGKTWTDLATGFLADVYSVEFLDINNIFVGTSGGVIKSTDGGANWQKIAPSFQELQTLIRSICFFDLDTGYIYSYYGIYFTSNGGQTWDTLGDPKNALPFWQYYYELTFVDHQKGYMAASENMPTQLLKTIDGCRSWHVDSSFASITDFIVTLYIDKQHNGWCVGNFGSIHTNKIFNNAGIKKNLISGGLRTPYTIQTNNSYALVPLLNNTNQVLLYDCTGRLVSSHFVSPQYHGKETFPVNIEKLSRGLYFLALKSNEMLQKTYKVIKR